MRFTREDLVGAVLTVNGLLEPDKLGVTQPHEHCVFDLSLALAGEPEDEEARRIYYAPVSLELFPYVRYGYDNVAMYQQFDTELAMEELGAYKAAGGCSLVDQTPIDAGRDPQALQLISQKTGLNIVMGGAYYVKISREKHHDVQRSVKELADEMTDDILKGVGDTGIHSGIVGEVGCSWPLQECERRTLEAAAATQQQTGAAISVHPGRHPQAPFEIMEVLSRAGADLSRCVICHIDRTYFDWDSLCELESLANSGCYLEWDLFGAEGYYPESFAAEGERPIDMLNDAGRIRFIKEMVARGFGNRVLISQDIDVPYRYMKWGGHGFAHILRNVVPAMRRRGVSESEIEMFMVRNPRQLLTF